MAKRKRTDNTMAKRKKTGNTMAKSKGAFLLAIVLSVLLRNTYSDYPFGIFKLFLNSCDNLRVTLVIYRAISH